jgi:hypothetical protein
MKIICKNTANRDQASTVLWHFRLIISDHRCRYLPRFLNRYEVVSSPHSVIPLFSCSLVPLFPSFFFVKIEKFLQKCISHPFLRGRVPKNTCGFFLQKNLFRHSRLLSPKFFLSPQRQEKIKKKSCQNRKIPACLDSPTPK